MLEADGERPGKRMDFYLIPFHLELTGPQVGKAGNFLAISNGCSSKGRQPAHAKKTHARLFTGHFLNNDSVSVRKQSDYGVAPPSAARGFRLISKQLSKRLELILHMFWLTQREFGPHSILRPSLV